MPGANELKVPGVFVCRWIWTYLSDGSCRHWFGAPVTGAQLALAVVHQRSPEACGDLINESETEIYFRPRPLAALYGESRFYASIDDLRRVEPASHIT